MAILNPWLVFSLILFGIWLIIFLLKKSIRKEMFLVSLITMPFGLTEPLFIPEYWNPPSLFNLAANTGFDIESLIFSFAIGGIGAVIYEAFFKVRHVEMSRHEKGSRRHIFHLLALFSPVLVFIILFFLTNLNPIYSASISMFIGGVSAALCRPDLKEKSLIGGFLFLILYFIFFPAFNFFYPNAVYGYWNLEAISGILILGVPLEELTFAFTFGLMWSGIYEHLMHYKLNKTE